MNAKGKDDRAPAPGYVRKLRNVPASQKARPDRVPDAERREMARFLRDRQARLQRTAGYLQTDFGATRSAAIVPVCGDDPAQRPCSAEEAAQADWTRGPRTMTRNREEYQIQVALVAQFWLRRTAGALCLASANGELRDEITGAKLKRMGVRAGTPDLWVVVPGRPAFWIELKIADGRLSVAQRELIPEMRAAGVTVHVAHGLDEALAILETEGAISPTVGIASNSRNAGAGVGVASRTASAVVVKRTAATGQRRASQMPSAKAPKAAVMRQLEAIGVKVSPDRVHVTAGGR
jgi:hypothetical protein